VVRNILSSFLSKSLIACTLLAILLIQTRQLGSEVVGQVSLFILNLAIIQTISDIYTGSALVYFIPKYNVAKIYSNGLLWTFVCIVVINVFFYVFNIGIKEFWLHVFVLSFVSTINAFHNVILLAKEKIRTYNFLMFLQPVLLFIFLCICILMLEINTVYAFIISAYASYSILFIVSAYHLIILLNKEKGTKPVAKMSAILQNGIVNQLGNLAHTLSNRYNYYLLAGVAMVGVYASATSLIESVWLLSGSISPVILTHIANQNDVHNNSRVTLLLSKISFLLSIAAVLTVLILPESFFNGLLGKDFAGTKSIMLHLSPGVLAISFSSILSHYFSGLGKQKILLAANASGLLITLSTAYYFIQNFGMLGAAYTASLAYLAQALVLTIVFMKQNKFGFSELLKWSKDLDLLNKKTS
jgi:O-antigen/teichoic acid export membrane protein